MTEIDKLRQRLTNIAVNAKEYRMSVIEARALISEFEALEKKLAEKPQPQVIISAPTEMTRILDGGSF